MMKYNVYDFDKTIYKRDSTFDFYLYCIKKRPRVLSELPVLGVYAVLFGLKICSKTEFKERFYRFLRHLGPVDELVEEFWDEHRGGIADYYHEIHQETDVVISASPEFLLKPVCRHLGIFKLIASRVDRHTGIYFGENCWGEEKVRRFREEMPDAEVAAFYSDSLSDTPKKRFWSRPAVSCRGPRNQGNHSFETQFNRKIQAAFGSFQKLLFYSGHKTGMERAEFSF